MLSIRRIENSCLGKEINNLIGHSSKRVLVPIISYENEISFICKLNSFSYEWLCTTPRFDREA